MSEKKGNKINNTQFPQWFKNKYPQEYYFYTQIGSNLNKIFSHTPLELNVGEFEDIVLNVTKLGNSMYRLDTNGYGMIFLGSLGKTIIDEFNNNVETVISEAVRQEFDNRLSVKCSKCNNMNLAGSMFCSRCGSDVTFKTEK